MKCHLVHLTGPNKGLATSFESARVTVGRAASCDLHFDPFDVTVAPHHAEILVDEDGRYYVHDLGSRSGTFVNGERVHHRAMLHPEDIIQFGEGGPEVSFRLGNARPGIQPLPPEPLPFGELTFTSGADAGRTFIIPADAPTRVGRRADVEVALDPQGDLVVSGNHCTIEYWNTSFILTDTSRNGTFINGHPVEGGRALLQDSDEVTFGESGPRAMFRVMPARRVYPNLVARHAPPAAVPPPSEADELESFAQQPADAPPASAAEQPSADVNELRRRIALRGARPLPAAPPQHRPRVPLKINLIRKHPAPIPRLRKRHIGRTLALGALFLGAVAAGFVAWRAAQRTAPGELTWTEKLADQVENARSHLAGEGKYSLLVPAGWSVQEEGPGVLLEPEDSSLAVDYYRGSGLTADAVRQLVSMDGAKTVDLTGQAAGHGDARVSGFLSRSGGTARLAVLHEPEKDIPAVAMLEAPVEKFAEIPESVLASLLVEGVKLQELAPKAAPPPVPVPEATPAPGPDPVVVAEAGPVETTGTSPSVPEAQETTAGAISLAQATPTPEPTPAAAGTPEGEETRLGTALGLDVRVPAGWTGTEDAAEKVLLLHSPQQFDIRIARDPNKLDMNELVAALQSEGWKSAARPTVTPRFHAVNLEKGEENVILVLIPEPAGTTLVVYSTKQGALSQEEREQVSGIVGDLLETVDD